MPKNSILLFEQKEGKTVAQQNKYSIFDFVQKSSHSL